VQLGRRTCQWWPHTSTTAMLIVLLERLLTTGTMSLSIPYVPHPCTLPQMPHPFYKSHHIYQRYLTQSQHCNAHSPSGEAVYHTYYTHIAISQVPHRYLYHRYRIHLYQHLATNTAHTLQEAPQVPHPLLSQVPESPLPQAAHLPLSQTP
jgi:hypothetical protein